MKKRNASLKSSMKSLLSLKPNKENSELLTSMGMPKAKLNNGAVVMAALMSKASKGEVSAIKEVLSIVEDENVQEKGNVSKLFEALSREEE